MKFSMLLMSYSYCPLPVRTWLIEKGLGTRTREIPCCKNTVKTSACLCSKENRSLVEDVNGKLPSLKGTMCAPLCGNLLFTAGLGESSKSSAGTRAKEASMVHVYSKARGWKLSSVVLQHDTSGGSLAHLPLKLPWRLIGKRDWRNPLPDIVSFCIMGSVSSGPVKEGLCSWYIIKKSLFSQIFLSHITNFLGFRTLRFYQLWSAFPLFLCHMVLFYF